VILASYYCFQADLAMFDKFVTVENWEMYLVNSMALGNLRHHVQCLAVDFKAHMSCVQGVFMYWITNNCCSLAQVLMGPHFLGLTGDMS
jgi:hypothetical protein